MITALIEKHYSEKSSKTRQLKNSKIFDGNAKRGSYASLDPLDKIYSSEQLDTDRLFSLVQLLFQM